jgi:hypothetical protein
MRGHLLAFTSAAAIALTAASAFAADAPDPTARRVPVKFGAAIGCSSAVDRFPTLKAAYYTDLKTVSNEASAIVNGCVPTIKDGDAVVLLFFIKSTEAAEKPALVHIVMEKSAEETRPLHDLLGHTTIHWLYITDDDCDETPVVELSVTKTVNPAIASAGALAKTIITAVPTTGAAHGPGLASVAHTESLMPSLPPPVPACSQNKPAGDRVHLSLGEAELPYDRGTVTEALYLRRILRNDDGQWLKDDGKTPATFEKDAGWAQVEGSAEFTSTPLSFVTFHAGAAILTGTISGARQMKIDSKTFVSDPMKRATTLAGVSWHLPFDGTEPSPSKKESIGLFTGAVLTPAVGVSIGGVYSWRGVGAFVGWGWMWVNTAPGNLIEGAAVADGATLVMKPASGLLLGATYTFGS